MPVFDSCCCCSLKTGCKIFGFLGIIFYSIIAVCCVLVLLLEHEIARQAGIPLHTVTVLRYVSIAVLVICIIAIISYLCLVIGAYNEKPGLVLPYLILTGIGISLNIILVIFAISQTMIPPIIGGVVQVAFDVLIWLVVFSFRQELRQGKRTRGVEVGMSALINKY